MDHKKQKVPVSLVESAIRPNEPFPETRRKFGRQIIGQFISSLSSGHEAHTPTQSDRMLTNRSRAMFHREELRSRSIYGIPTTGNYDHPAGEKSKVERMMAEFVEQLPKLELDWQPDDDGTRVATVSYAHTGVGENFSFAGTSLEKELSTPYEGPYSYDSVATVTLRTGEDLVLIELRQDTSKNFHESKRRDGTSYTQSTQTGEIILIDRKTGDYAIAHGIIELADKKLASTFDILSAALESPKISPEDNVGTRPLPE